MNDITDYDMADFLNPDRSDFMKPLRFFLVTDLHYFDTSFKASGSARLYVKVFAVRSADRNRDSRRNACYKLPAQKV